MKFIKENIERIQKSDNVLMLKPIKSGHKSILVAIMAAKNGGNEIVPLTKSFDFKINAMMPLEYFFDVVSDEYSKKFTYMDFTWGFNKKLLKDFSCQKTVDHSECRLIYAHFKEGSIIPFVIGDRECFNDYKELAKSNKLKQNEI